MIEDKAGDMPPDQSSMFTRVLYDPTNQAGFMGGGEHTTKRVRSTQVKASFSCPFLLIKSNHFYYLT